MKCFVLNRTYILNGNQLKEVTGAATAIPANRGMHFIDGSGATTEYTYDSDGNLTQDLNKGISCITMTAGNISYLYSADGTNSSFHYYLKDHQGNNRVVINYAGGVEQVNHYYPFGALFAESINGTVQKYKYNGKELDTTNNLNLYDYGARSYDSVLGIWTIQDPLVEKYYPISPYAYCEGNP